MYPMLIEDQINSIHKHYVYVCGGLIFDLQCKNHRNAANPWH